MTNNKMSTMETAEYMLRSGRFYTASTLHKELGITLNNASGNIYNIRKGKKYQTVENGKPVSVKVTDIQGVKRKEVLWSKLLNKNWST